MTGLTPTRRSLLKTAGGTALVGGLAVGAGGATTDVAEGPTVYVGTKDIYAGGAGDALYAVDAITGDKKWAYPDLAATVESSPTVVDGTAYIGSGLLSVDRDVNNLYAVDAATGNQEWVFTEPLEPVVTSPTVVDGTVYVGNPALYAVDAATGDQKWAFTNLSSAYSSPSVANGTVYIGSTDGTLYAVDAATGDQEWAFTVSDDPYEGVDSSPTVVDGTVYVGAKDATLYALDAITGEQEWVFTEPSATVRSSPTVVDGTIYVGSHDNTLYAVDAATGDQEWAFTKPSRGVVSSPTVVDGTIYVGCRDNTLYAVDAATGTQEWAFTEPSDSVRSSPTVADGTVYVGSSDGVLYAVDAATGTQEWAFTDSPFESVVASPTVVMDPQDGNSVGSRVRLGTLGHHDDRDVPEQDVAVALSPATAELQPGSAMTLNLVVENVIGGVGTFALDLAVSDPDVVAIDAITPTNDPAFPVVEIAADGARAALEVAMGSDVYDPGDPVVASVTLAGVAEGTGTLAPSNVRVTDDDTRQYEIGRVTEATLTVTEEAGPPPVVGETPPQDLTGDGLYRDVTGDGEVSVADVQALFGHRNDEVIQTNAAAFNFSGTDPTEVTIADVQALFAEIQSQTSDRRILDALDMDPPDDGEAVTFADVRSVL